MSEPTWVTVNQAVALTDRSKTVIYDVMRSGAVKTTESTRGNLVHLADLRRVLAQRRPGRPRGSAKRQ